MLFIIDIKYICLIYNTISIIMNLMRSVLGGVVMRVNLNELKQDKVDKHVYTYHSAKKIYLACTPSKYILLEKKDIKPSVLTLSLVSRNTVVISKENGMLIFPKNR